VILALMASTADAENVKAAAYPIAGLTPYQRPAGAPTVTTYTLSAEATTKALHGVSEPIPPSLSFLRNQGAWYNPFLQPGMTGPYDIRAWHTAEER
jgi:hypothetical protein